MEKHMLFLEDECSDNHRDDHDGGKDNLCNDIGDCDAIVVTPQFGDAHVARDDKDAKYSVDNCCSDDHEMMPDR